MNIKKITDQLLCSGCGTCNTICGTRAISMKKTNTMGLLYANIDTSKCTECGLCLKMCPSANILQEKSKVTKDQIIGQILKCFIGRSLDNEIFANAQSGGLVTTILTYLFDNNLIDAAVSCRMEHASPVPKVHYSILTSSEELKYNQKSCYTQVDIVSAINEIKHYNSVAIVGVPCQIQGISNLMKLKRFCNISYRVGLICDKTYSDTYMDAIMYGAKLPSGDISINYRQKNFTHKGQYHSYQQAPTVITNKEGELCILPNSKRMFLKDYFAVPKCKLCWDKLNVRADIVLGDPWGLKGKYDENEGDSVIIVRSDLGNDIVSNLQSNGIIRLSDVSIEEVAKGQLVDKRVSDIINFDWNKKVSDWNYYESLTKPLLLKTIEKQYRRYVYKTKLFAILSRIKHIIK